PDSVADRGGTRDQAVRRDGLELRERWRAGDRVTQKRARMDGFARGRRPGVHGVRRADRGAERHAAGECLACYQDVGDRVDVFAGEPAPRPTDARIDLVEDEQDPVAVAALTECGQELWRRYDDAAASEYRLDDDRADRLRRSLCICDRAVEGVEACLEARCVRVACAVRVGHMTHAGEQLLRERGAEVAAVCDGQCAERETVICALEGDDAAASRAQPGGLDGCLDGLGPGAAEDGYAEVARRDR